MSDSNENENENEIKKDFEALFSPHLILIADSPLSNDKFEIFDSLQGVNYLDRCFSSKFKIINTHVSYVNGRDENFVHETLFKIFYNYHTVNRFDFNKLVIGFIGQDAFDSFIKSYQEPYIEDEFKVYLYQDETKRLNIFSPRLYYRPFDIPYVILPSLEDNKSNITQILNDIPFTDEIDRKYAETDEVLTRLEFIYNLYKEGSLKYFQIDSKINANLKRFNYLSIYDRYTGKPLLYDFKTCLKTPEERQTVADTFKKVLTTVPVHGKNIEEAMKLFSWHEQITILNQEDIDEKPLERKSFVFSGDENHKNGPKSEWYHKWYIEAYLPHIKSSMDETSSEFAMYKDHCKYEWIYDIEVFKHDWLFIAKSMDGKNKVVCWNDGDSLAEWIRNKILIGFNNAAYDNPVISHAMSEPYLVAGSKNVKEYSDSLIFDDEGRAAFPKIRKDSKGNPIKNIPSFLSWDLSFHMPFDIRRNSLKKLTMSVLDRKNYDSAVSFDTDRALTKLEREEVERYCEMDVDNTRDLFLPDPEDIEKAKEDPKHKFREYARESYDIRWNLIIEYKMKAKTLINKAASFAGKLLCGEEAKPNPKNTFKVIDGKPVFYSIPELAYKELAGTPLLDFYIKNQTNPDYIHETFEYYMGGDDEGHLYQFGFGGLHQALLKYGSTNLVNMDVASLYPSLLVNYGLMSRGASKNPQSYEEVYKTRLKAKKEGKTLLNLGLKLILNGSIGAMLSVYNSLYDTWSNSTICVHGQLLLFILCKRLYEAGYKIIQTNTDGIMIETNNREDYMAICNCWQEETKLILEFDDIAILQQNNVNNYYCQFTNGKVKSKGFYLSNEKFGKATSKILCNLVTNKPLLEGTTPKDFVIFKRHSVGEIYDGITRTKLEGRSLAFVVGYPEDKRTQSYYSRSRNERSVVKKDEKGKPILDENGNQVTEIINSESKITGFTDHMLLVDDMNALTMDEINYAEYINFAKNLLDKEEDFGPYYNENFVKVEEPAFLQALNQLKDYTSSHPTNAGVVCQNFLFECDYATKEEQEEMIEGCKDKLYRVVWSGNKSYHCVVRIDKPVTSTVYKKIWYHLQNKLGFIGADTQCAIPSKYTRVPDQINPKTGNVQTLYLHDKNILSTAEILDEMPKIKEQLKKPTEYKGKITIEALKRHINRQNWDEGNRFSSVQKLSPALISQVSLEELLTMIPIKLDKDHRKVLQSKLHYWKKYKLLEEMQEQLKQQEESQNEKAD